MSPEQKVQLEREVKQMALDGDFTAQLSEAIREPVRRLLLHRSAQHEQADFPRRLEMAVENARAATTVTSYLVTTLVLLAQPPNQRLGRIAAKLMLEAVEREVADSLAHSGLEP